MDDYVSVGEARKILGVSSRTLRRYTQIGTLPDVRSLTGRRIFSKGELQALRGGKNNHVILYARVSSRRQEKEGDLQRQTERLQELATTEDRVSVTVTDVASGLSDTRVGLMKVCDLVKETQYSEVWVTTEDRLSRFGGNLLVKYCDAFHVTIRVCEPDMKERTQEQELVQDMLNIITSFSGRLYGQRSAKSKQLRARLKEELSTK